ncbi:hypothetical protein [Halalkalibacter akibai]|uniref:Uncharacterized protein n=1 Tax=Halalkalibacter akibai (strain ATCC 43226 / DSM 21942 / CIP 109018 / JCM 9157 / 1139) TaxID=1236973 RepID=W4QRK4_HALA3|nr:hypothetical protein [Halalkalibacter akibai]GAE34731.1 hypothetical protein JCM9157_1808 [Halalkalibacter akibai JCM 9157]
MVHWKVTAILKNGDYVLQYGSSETEERAQEQMKEEETLIREQYKDDIREMDYWL